jgi:hypothetical protein
MLYLMDEMYHQRGKKIHITFGKAITPDKFDDSKSDVEWAQYVKEFIYSNKTKLNEVVFDGK